MKHIKITQNMRSFGAGALILLTLVGLVLALSPQALAQEEQTAGKVVPSEARAPNGLDDGFLELGVEWVEDYPAGWGDLPATRPDALGLVNQLTSCGWTRRFAWGNGWAWEQDWKGYSKPGGGTEYYWIDSVDLAYFAGHGNSSGIFFGVGGNTRDDSQLHYNDCRLEWGDGDAEWVGLAACNVLADSHKDDWYQCMDGLHLILGFVTTMADVPHGNWFGWYLCRGYNMTQAWFRASDALQPQGKIARVLAEELAHFYDRPNNHVGGDTFWNNHYWYWDHTVGSEPARHVDLQQLGGTMPVFQTPPLSLDEANNKWSQLGQAFNVPTTPRTTQGDPIWVSDDNQLEMDPSQGLYIHTDLNSLWAEQPALQNRSVETVAVTQQGAQEIADAFLTDNGLMPSDAEFYEVTADLMSAAEVVTTTGRLSERILQNENTAWQVIYSRIVTHTLSQERGPAQTVEFSVMGPGAKLKVYVAPEIPAGLSLREAAQQAVIGGVGGWRGLDQAGGRSVQQTVPILGYDQIQKLLEQLEPTVALSYIPMVFESRDILTHTVAYYEHPIGTGQDQLIPVYALEMEYTLVNQEVVSSTVYIPANETYMAPFAGITPVSEVPSSVAVGDELVFEAVDSTTPLSELGYDPSLSFALGTGDPDSYIYNWYVNTIAPENKIGSGQTLTYTVGLDEEALSQGGQVSQTIILEVTDTFSPRPPSTSVANYQITVVEPIHLPLIRNH